MRGLILVVLLTAAASEFCAGQSSPRLVVVNKGENAIAIVDVQSGKVLGHAPSGEGPHEVAVSADGRTAYVSNYGSREPGHSISIIDLGSLNSRQLDLGPLRRPHGLAEFGGQVYFTVELNKLIGRYDPAADRVDWLMGTGQNSTHMAIVSRDGARMFTANIGSDSITVFERPPTPAAAQNPLAWNETAIAVGKGPEGMDLSPDGRELWAAGSRDGSVSIVDVAQKKVVQTLNVQTRRSNRLKFTPDGKLVLISDLDAGELLVLDAASRRQVKRIPLGREVEGILIAPEGGRAYVAVSGDDNIAVVDLKTFSVVSRLQSGKGPDGMAWAK
ncbi:MAG TPA: YncE family protein [Terriglobales bacterium]|nr:YncE family protein [Terriglobales bacterium]